MRHLERCIRLNLHIFGQRDGRHQSPTRARQTGAATHAKATGAADKGSRAEVRTTESIGQRAREVQVLMAARGHHRAAGVIDLLTAAVAEYHGAVVMHYDADFEHIAASTGQPQAWVMPQGTID